MNQASTQNIPENGVKRVMGRDEKYWNAHQFFNSSCDSGRSGKENCEERPRSNQSKMWPFRYTGGKSVEKTDRYSEEEKRYLLLAQDPTTVIKPTTPASKNVLLVRSAEEITRNSHDPTTKDSENGNVYLRSAQLFPSRQRPHTNQLF